MWFDALHIQTLIIYLILAIHVMTFLYHKKNGLNYVTRVFSVT